MTLTFDAGAMAWYAAICGALAALAPSLRTPVRRIALGAAVGIIAASVLPATRALLGF
ncbi:MAG: hypothetical protein ACE360_04635 [Hyphomicrobiales bacterium]|jgi:hypothetical protein